MNIGRLDRLITIQEKATSRDTIGGVVETWTQFAEVWAQKMPLRGTERYEAQQFNAEVTDKWRIRYLSGVKPTMRINYDSENYDIESVLELGRREAMELVTTVSRNG